MEDTRSEAVEGLIKPIVAEHGMELVELTIHAHSGKFSILILVDKPGGVTIAQCAKVNQRIGQAFDEANIIGDSYTIEVSSPGLDRPLANKRDFERAIGELIRLEILAEDGRLKELEGIVLAVQSEAVVIKTSDANFTVPFTQIRGAKKVIRW